MEAQSQNRKNISFVELLKIFPEAKEIIPEKLKELEQQREALVDVIKDSLLTISAETAGDKMSNWFWRRWLQLTLGQELLVIDRHTGRLKRQLRVVKGLPAPRGALTDDLIQSAREVPVESLLEKPPRSSGHDLVGLCPLHTERTPSFHIYTNENRGWCFGCSRGGDPIDIYMLVHDCGFKEAVLSLTGDLL